MNPSWLIVGGVWVLFLGIFLYFVLTDSDHWDEDDDWGRS